MNPEPAAQPGSAASWQEDGTTPVGQPQDGSGGRGERQVVSVLASDGR
jgi:hypothetical protein